MKTIKTILSVIYILLIVTMASATILEKTTGTTFVNENIYGSWWFCAMWALLTVVAVAYIFKTRLFKRPATFSLHMAFIVILIGALISHIFGSQTTMHIRIGDTNNDLPFVTRLENFSVENYPGTQSPMDFTSELTFIDADGTNTSVKVSMNNIGEHNGYRFYQSAYDYDARGTILAVSHDPWGIGITYTGYMLLFVSMFLLLVMPNEGFRKALKKVSKSALIAILLMNASDISASPKTLPDSVATKLCDLHVYYNGRICPLQTVAIDFTKKIYGKSSYGNYSAEQVFSGWVFFPSTWETEPFIKVKGGDKSYVSFDEIYNRQNNSADNEKLNIIRMLLNGQMMKIYPYNDSRDGLIWLSQGDNLPMNMPEDQWFFIKKSLDYLGELAFTENYTDFGKTLDKIAKYQVKTTENTNILPSAMKFKAEKTYNTVNHTRPLAMALATIGILSFIFFTIRWSKGETMNRWILVAMNIIVGVVTVYLIGIISLRGYVAGHLPITNGYETMQFMSLTALVLTMALQKKFSLIFPFGILLAGLTLMVSMFGESNPQITNLMPVLASPLLSLHVCVIMIAYSLLAFMMMNGITALIIKATNNTYGEARSEALCDISRMLVYPAIFLLTTGIFIGAIWANQSWGRYWGWDPKEVWALITMMIYSVLLHTSFIPALNKARNYHIFTIVAFLTVLMTYFGVNFLLGGMHSYAAS